MGFWRDQRHNQSLKKMKDMIRIVNKEGILQFYCVPQMKHQEKRFSVVITPF